MLILMRHEANPQCTLAIGHSPFSFMANARIKTTKLDDYMANVYERGIVDDAAFISK